MVVETFTKNIVWWIVGGSEKKKTLVLNKEKNFFFTMIFEGQKSQYVNYSSCPKWFGEFQTSWKFLFVQPISLKNSKYSKKRWFFIVFFMIFTDQK